MKRRTIVLAVMVVAMFWLGGCAPVALCPSDPVQSPPGYKAWEMRQRAETIERIADEAFANHEYISDRLKYKADDLWESSLEGDCDDFSLYVWERLRAEGVGSRMVLAGTGNGRTHVAVLADGLLIDNAQGAIVAVGDVTYDWISMSGTRPGEPWRKVRVERR